MQQYYKSLYLDPESLTHLDSSDGTLCQVEHSGSFVEQHQCWSKVEVTKVVSLSELQRFLVDLLSSFSVVGVGGKICIKLCLNISDISSSHCHQDEGSPLPSNNIFIIFLFEYHHSHLPNHATLSLVMMQLGMSLTRLGETEYMVPGKCRLMVTTQSVGEWNLHKKVCLELYIYQCCVLTCGNLPDWGRWLSRRVECSVEHWGAGGSECTERVVVDSGAWDYHHPAAPCHRCSQFLPGMCPVSMTTPEH